MRIRPMVGRDVPDGMKLVEAAGWNQTPADWQRFLHAGTGGCFVAEETGHVCGTVTSILYGSRLAWVGMVLVNPAHRGRGIATELLENVLAYLDSTRVSVIGLDATAQGKPLYSRLGFGPVREIERWTLSIQDRGVPHDTTLTEPDKGGGDLDQIVQADREIVAADREGLLRSLHRDAPGFTASVQQGGALAGYALGRCGLNADHLGPWAAKDEPTAAYLLSRFIDLSARRTLIVDAMKPKDWIPSLLVSAGFKPSRLFTRMTRGSKPIDGQLDLLCGIVGPEFG
jgi:GNAT superfamily N-acetyltransferase